jgi:hypothetical protein
VHNYFVKACRTDLDIQTILLIDEEVWNDGSTYLRKMNVTMQPTSYVGRPQSSKYLDTAWTDALIPLGSGDQIIVCHPL